MFSSLSILNGFCSNFLLAVFFMATLQGTAQSVKLIPWPKTLTENTGSLNLTASSQIVYTDASLQSLANCANCPVETCAELAQEDFDYPATTNMDGANGGSGFANSWSLAAAMNGSFQVLDGSLNFSGHNSTGNKLRVTLQNEDASKWVSRDLLQAYQNGDTVWMSCLINPIVRADGGFWIKPNGNQELAIGKRWGATMAIDNNSTNINVQENVVNKLVVRYILNSTETIADLWVDRNEDFTDANANATKTGGAMTNFSSVSISMERWGDGVFEIDELYIGCEPVPSCSAGIACDDGDPCTENDVYDGNCNCAGVFADADNDGICDAYDDCPTGTNCCDGLLPQQSNLVLGGRSVLVLRGVDPATHTWDVPDSQLTTIESELDAYVRSISFNKAWVGDFDITPVYDFSAVGNTSYTYMSNTLRDLATAGGYDLSNYNVFIYTYRSTTDLNGAGALGSGNGLNGSVWYPGQLLWYYKGVIHETFHAFGLGHAETVEGGDVIFPGQVTGGHDPYHFMGSEGDGGLNADIPNYMKYFLGWIDADEITCVPDIPSSCVTHKIYKASTVGNYNNQHEYAIQVGDNLWMSYEPDNENTRIEKRGVLLHHIPGPGSAVTRLIDMAPGSITDLPSDLGSNWEPVIDFWDAAMVSGESLNWGGTQITIGATGGTGDEKWVEIEFCDCITLSGDSDNDGICDELDACAGFDDNLDADEDAIPDDCDDCPLDPLNDSNQDGICDNLQCLSETSEPFDYPANTGIAGANGGSGFSDAWTLGAAMNGSFEVLDGSLDYAGYTSAGNKLRVTLQNEDASKWVSRNLATPFLNRDTVWMSCLINPIVRADGGFWIKPNGRQDIAIGKRWGSEMAIDNNGSGINVQENTVSRLVVRYVLGANETVAHLWVNRNDDFTNANADATKTVGAIIPEMNSLHIVMERWGDGVFEIDELYMGCEPNPTEEGCQDYVQELDNSPLLESRQAQIGIESNGILDIGGDIEYTAGEYILLDAGFEVKAGAIFHAYIQGCQ